jgi:hypothetical protein
MFDTLISGSILAILSALAYIAYHHPRFYSKIYNRLMASILSAFVVLFAYNFGVMNARLSIPYDTTKGIDEFKKISDIKDSLERIQVPMSYIIFGTLALLIYFSILYMLPTILNLPQDEKNDIPSNKKIK